MMDEHEREIFRGFQEFVSEKVADLPPVTEEEAEKMVIDGIAEASGHLDAMMAHLATLTEHLSEVKATALLVAMIEYATPEGRGSRALRSMLAVAIMRLLAVNNNVANPLDNP